MISIISKQEKQMNGFYKWLHSTKFQVAILCIGLIYLQQELYSLKAEIVTGALVKISIAYFGARVLEPVVEFLTKKIK